jgi:hypothetical protein
MEIDWMLLTYIVVIFFAIGGFFRGWWKEAITSLFLALLLLLLKRSDWAQIFINVLNQIIAFVWELVVRVLNSLFSLGLANAPFQFDASSSGTWIIILIITLGIAGLIGRFALPNYTDRPKGKIFSVGFIARVLGLLLGVVNGFLVMSLVREYLDGSALPGNESPATELTAVGTSTYGPAANSLSIQAVNLPNITILDSYLPWLIIGLGLLLFFAAIKSRVYIQTSKSGGRRIVDRAPYGYTRNDKKPPAPERPFKVEVTNQ